MRAEELGASPAQIGVMFGLLGVGAIAGALVAPTVARRTSPRFVILGSLWLWAIYPVALVTLPSAVAIGIFAGVVAVSGPIFNVVLSAYRYALVPDRLLGRVGSVILLVAWGTVPLGTIAAGFLLAAFGAVESMLVLAGVSLAVALGATLSRTVRNVPPAEELRLVEA